MIRRPRPTVRLRLTLTYTALFIVTGAALLGVSYILVQHREKGPSTAVQIICRNERSTARPSPSISARRRLTRARGPGAEPGECPNAGRQRLLPLLRHRYRALGSPAPWSARRPSGRRVPPATQGRGAAG